MGGADAEENYVGKCHMNKHVDSTGQSLPLIEMPSEDKLRVYGDLMFLAFRSDRHRLMSVQTLRSYLEPPIELGQFRVFRFDGVPRAMYTWARLDHEAERKLINGDPLQADDWCSGDRLWIVDLIAPYKGLTHSIGRWIMEKGNFSETEFLFRRVSGLNDTRRIVHVNFEADQLGRIYSASQFLQTL